LARQATAPLTSGQGVRLLLPIRRRCAFAATACAVARCTRRGRLAPATLRLTFTALAGAGNDHAVTIAQRRGARCDDPIPFGEPLEDFRFSVALDADVDGGERNSVVRRREEHTTAAAKVDDGVCRDEEGVLALPRRDAHASIHAWFQTEIRIRNLHLDWRGARGRVEYGCNTCDASDKFFVGEGIHVDTRVIADFQLV